MTLFKWLAIILIILGAFLIISNYTTALRFAGIRNFLASVFFVDSSTEQYLRDDFVKAKQGKENIKILIVPGHDADIPGAQFKNLKEHELNVELAGKIQKLLSQEKEFTVFLLQDKNGYSPFFSNYLEAEKENIKKFKDEQRLMMRNFVGKGNIAQNQTVFHNSARPEMAEKLYGVNKWSNDNHMDIVLHVHFNDYPGRKTNRPGQYSGFSIYIPERQFSNAKGSLAIAQSVFDRLKKYFAVSNMSKEDSGIIEDQELIAVGSNNSLDAAVLLVEYGYIYESALSSTKVRQAILDEMAFQTYLGIKNFFTRLASSRVKDTATLPYSWSNDLAIKNKNNEDIFAMQIALAQGGLYPPQEFSKNECPLSGNFGDCTFAAVKSFQQKYEIEPTNGFVGEVTRKKLNELYGD